MVAFVDVSQQIALVWRMQLCQDASISVSVMMQPRNGKFRCAHQARCLMRCIRALATMLTSLETTLVIMTWPVKQTTA